MCAVKMEWKSESSMLSFIGDYIDHDLWAPSGSVIVNCPRFGSENRENNILEFVIACINILKCSFVG